LTDSRDEVADALDGGFLEGREVRELSTDWGITFAVDILGDDAAVAGQRVTIRDHARTLWNRPEWFLHDRP
jgi:hypothetical protein